MTPLETASTSLACSGTTHHVTVSLHGDSFSVVSDCDEWPAETRETLAAISGVPFETICSKLADLVRRSILGTAKATLPPELQAIVEHAYNRRLARLEDGRRKTFDRWVHPDSIAPRAPR